MRLFSYHTFWEINSRRRDLAIKTLVIRVIFLEKSSSMNNFEILVADFFHFNVLVFIFHDRLLLGKVFKWYHLW